MKNNEERKEKKMPNKKRYWVIWEDGGGIPACHVKREGGPRIFLRGSSLLGVDHSGILVPSRQQAIKTYEAIVQPESGQVGGKPGKR
jgi:hypothetical protein